MKFILLLQSDRATAYALGRARHKKSVSFNLSDSGVADFSEFLHLHSKDEFKVLLDFDSEQIHQEKIPDLGSRDRKSIMLHHRRKQFGDTCYSSGFVSDQQTNADTKLNVALIGLPSSEVKWLALLERACVRVRSSHWMTLLVLPLIRSLNVKSAIVLAILRMDAGDDRLVAYSANLPLISRRLASQPGDTTEPAVAGELLAEQVKQTFGYLERMSGLSVASDTPGNAVTTIAIGEFSKAEIDRVDQQLQVLGADLVVTVSVSSLADLTGGVVGSKGGGSASLTEVLARSVVHRKPSACSFICWGARFLQRRVRHALYGVSLSLIGCAAVATAAVRYVGDDLDHLQQFAIEFDAQVLELKQASPLTDLPEGTSVNTIRESLLHVATIERVNDSTPFHFLALLAEQLTRYPGIELTSVNWASVNPTFGGQQSIDSSGSLQRSSRPRSTKGIDSRTAAGINPVSNHYSAFVSGYVVVEADGVTGSMSQFRLFVASLRNTTSTIEISIVEHPFGAAGRRAPAAARGNFTLEISPAVKQQ